MTTTVDIMQSTLYKSLKKMGVSHNTAIQAWTHTRNKSLKSKTLSERPLDIDAYTNIGFTEDEAIEMQTALVAAKGKASDVNFIQVKRCIN